MFETKTKISIIWSMRKWTFKYIKWRLTTAYPNGWKFIILHPFIFIKDIWHYLNWCQMIDRENN
ncbi:MAG: hypothetical protein CMF80_03250 [Candidatus Marinimicrobia bacterium]|jgi:hypothetical protein|nr:hypothetical protein [Candidatus Neomarinimicrobiota bacterium]